MLTTAALAPRSGPAGTCGRVDGIRSRPRAPDPAAPGGAQPQRGSARMPRGPAIPAARARRLRRRPLSGAYHDFEDGTRVVTLARAQLAQELVRVAGKRTGHRL